MIRPLKTWWLSLFRPWERHLPPYQPDPGTQNALLSQAKVCCPRCGACEATPDAATAGPESARWLAGHCPADPDAHRLHLAGDPAFTERWLADRGHEIADVWDTNPFVVAFRPSRAAGHRRALPVQRAPIGSTLRWDGQHIRIYRSAP